MTRTDPPWLAVALLRRFVHDNEPLVGDLLEEFAVRRSRLWLWRQVLAAVAIRASQRREEGCPLGLHGHTLPHVDARTRPVQPPRHVNLSASPLPDSGGLGLVALGVLVAVVRPDVWWMAVPAVLGGVALGLTMVLLRRRAVLAGPASTRRTVLPE